MNDTQTAPPLQNLPEAKAGSDTPAAKKAETRTSPYLVLTKAGDKDSWTTLDTVTAKNPNDAIEQAVAKLSEELQAGVYVAVAIKRWNPTEIEAKVERSLVLKRVK